MIYKTVNRGDVMEKLMKPAEYAKEQGISRQAVYAKIKRGILRVKDVEGKLYIIVEGKQTDAKSKTESSRTSTSHTAASPGSSSQASTSAEEYQKLLAAKDETIAVLKGTVEDLKESNRQMSTTLKGEIDLLKSAFSEMRSLYMHRIDQMKVQKLETQEVLEAEVKQPAQAQTLTEWIGVKRLLKEHNIVDEKEKEKIIKRLKKAYKNGDARLKKIDGKLKVNAAKAYEVFSD